MAHARIELGEGELSLVFGGLLLFAGFTFLGCHWRMTFLIHELGSEEIRASSRLTRLANGPSSHSPLGK